MAGTGAKKRAEDNSRTVALLAGYILVCAGLHALVRLWLRGSSADWTSWAALAGTLAVQGLCWLSVAAVARPVYDNGVLVDGGADLSKGVISYYFDVVYVTGFAQLCAAASKWGWCVLLAAPAFGAYIVGSKAAGLFAAAKPPKEAEMDEATRKRLERAEKRSERRRVKRI